MTAFSAKLRCGFQDGMSTFEPTETEAAALPGKGSSPYGQGLS
jgi:hypothetical protein